MSNIYDVLIQEAYEVWTGSDEYWEQSALENGGYDSQKNEAIRIIGEESYHDVSDYFTSAACEAERAGFEHGFRIGIEFMQGLLNANQKKARATS